MTLRTRVTLWHTAMLMVALVVMASVFHYEFREDRLAWRAGKTPLDSPLEETGEFLLYVGLPFALVLVVGSTWLMRRFLTPVARLTDAVERIELHRLPERLATTGSGDELDRLTAVFNAMTTRLHTSFGQMREFTLHASHELKTPLTIMRGELETVLREGDSPEAQREFLAGLLDEVHRLVRIVDSLSLLAKADSGQLRLRMEPVDFAELVQDSHADAQVLAQRSHLQVALSQCRPAVIQGDRHRLRQLLLLLTDNAIKYNQPEGRVEIALIREQETALLRIVNTGPGIPPEDLPRVFDRFFRGDPAHNPDTEGCGLGLTIARWIVQAHDGEIRIESAPGRETIVTVRLPLADPAPALVRSTLTNRRRGEPE